MKTKTEIIHECKTENAIHWTEKLEIWALCGDTAFVTYFYLINGEWKKQAQRKGTLKIRKSKKGYFITYKNKRRYLNSGEE